MMKFLKLLMWVVFITHLAVIVGIIGNPVITLKSFWDGMAHLIFALVEFSFLLILHLIEIGDKNRENNNKKDIIL